MYFLCLSNTQEIATAVAEAALNAAGEMTKTKPEVEHHKPKPPLEIHHVHEHDGFHGVGGHEAGFHGDGNAGFHHVGHVAAGFHVNGHGIHCLLYTSPSPRDKRQSRMPSSA